MSDIKQLISIIIPVYNESESIGFLLNEVISVMESNKLNLCTDITFITSSNKKPILSLSLKTGITIEINCFIYDIYIG